MKNYKNGKIYVLRNHINNLVYVGSTTQPLYKRFSKHKCSRNCPTRQNFPLYSAMREIGIEQFYIELVEEYPCENIEQLLKREGYWIREFDSFNNGYNGKIEGRSMKEYKEEHKEKLSEYHKDYRQKNQDNINKKMRDYILKHKDMINEKRRETVECECGKTVCKGALSRHKKTQYHLSKAS